MKKILLSGALAAVVLSLAMLGAWLYGHVNDTAEAGPMAYTPSYIIGIDLDTTGNSCPNDGLDPGTLGYNTTCTGTPACDCTLGTIDRCEDEGDGGLEDGDTFNFDVFLKNIPPDSTPGGVCESWLGGSYKICEKHDTANVGTITKVGHIGGAIYVTDQPGSSLSDMSDASAVLPTCYKMNVADMGYAEYAPTKGIYTKGVIGRYTFTVGSAGAGLYGLTLETVKLGSDTMAGCTPATLVADEIRDSTFSPAHGIIAIGQACPADANIEFTQTLHPWPACTGTLPAEIDVSENYDVCVKKVLTTDNDVTATITKVASAPADCTILPTNPAPTTVAIDDITGATHTEQFTIHCTKPSNHGPFTITNTVVPQSQFVGDADGPEVRVSNFSVDAIAYADLKETAFGPPSASALPPVKPELGIPTILVNTDNAIQMVKVLHNNGPLGSQPDFAPDVLITPGSTIVGYVGYDAATYGPICTLTQTTGGPYQITDLPVSGTSMTIPTNYNLRCIKNIEDSGDPGNWGGIEKDDDDDGMIDEDPIGDADGDGHNDDDFDCPNGTASCSTPIASGGCMEACDEDSPFIFVIVKFDNDISIKDPDHVIDPEPGNNDATYPDPLTAPYFGLPIAVIRDFNPTFSYTAKDEASPTQASPDPNKVCVVYQPCKTESSATIPFNEPMAGQATIAPDLPGEMWYNSGAAYTSPDAGCTAPFCAWPGVTTTEKTGNITASVYANFTSSENCTTLIPIQTDHWDACLPPSGYTPAVTWVNGFVDDGTACAVDTTGLGLLPVPPAGGRAFTHWPVQLDGLVAMLMAANPGPFPSGPEAFLWARYVGVAVIVDNAPVGTIDLGDTLIPVNILIFDMSGGLGLGPWMSFGVTGDPSAPPSAPSTCAPFSSDTITLGETISLEEPIKQCLAPTDPLLTPGAAGGPHLVIASYTRLDIGEKETLYDYFNCTAMTNVYCGLDKEDETPEFGVDLLEQTWVDIDITNEDISTDVIVKATIVSDPDECPAEWKAFYSEVDSDVYAPTGPIIVGDKQISTLTFMASDVSPGGSMGAPETRTARIEYKVLCEAGTHDIDITVNLDPTPMDDDDMLDNQCQNHVVATATDTDEDNDTYANNVDNCPRVANPDQKDNDGDALIDDDADGYVDEDREGGTPADEDGDTLTDEDPGGGDKCDLDDDNDGVLDTADDCPFLAEDDDGDDDTDGCPESDVRDIVVTKDHEYDVDVSETATKTVTTRVTNGNYTMLDPDGILFIELLKSDVTDPDDKCEAHWVDCPGPNCVEDTVWEDFDGDTLLDELVLYSQLEVVVDAPANDYIFKTADYEVHCTARCTHKVFLEEAAIPKLPVIDPDISNGNVHKQWITIHAYGQADVKELAYEIHDIDIGSGAVPYVPGMEIPANTDVTVRTKKVLHNNGPDGPVTVNITYSETVPTDCTLTPVSVWGSRTLAVSIADVIYNSYTLNCKPCDHEIVFENEIGFTAEHLEDPDLTNNSGEATLEVEVIGTAAVTAGVVVSAPSTLPVSETEWFDVTKTFTNTGPNGPITPKVTQVMEPTDINKADCRLSFHVTADLLYDTTGLVIKKDGVVVSPPTPAGWQISDVVTGAYGGKLEVAYNIPLAVSTPVIVEEDWDKHCTKPSTHSFKLVTDVAGNTTGSHITWAAIKDTQTWTEDITAKADLKVCDWYFLDADKDLGSNTWAVRVEPSWTPDYSDWDRQVHEKEVIHNNGPYGPVDVLKTITADPNPDCGVAYIVTGFEDEIRINTTVQTGLLPGDAVDVDYPDQLEIDFQIDDVPVSVNVWQSELWSFNINKHKPSKDLRECAVHFTKELELKDIHISDPTPADAVENISMRVCADQDGDTVADLCPSLSEKDNCTAVANADQKDTDGDGLGDKCDGSLSHEVEMKYCLKFGPAPANLSDTQGRYMWVICEIGNNALQDEVVEISLSVTGAPSGCTQSSDNLILPGQDEFVIEGPQGVDNDLDTSVDEDPIDGVDNDLDTSVDEDPPEGEQKFLLWRVRYECHSEVEDVYVLDVKACVDPQPSDLQIDDDKDGSFDEDPVNGEDDDGDSLIDEDPAETGDGPEDCHEQQRALIVSAETP